MAPGKLADMVVLSHDIFTVAPAAILETAVVAAILDGRLVYDGESSDIRSMVRR